MIDYMLRLAGADFGLASVVAVGDFVRHYGTKQTGFVTKVMPQYDSTAELLVRPFPVRYDSLSYHRAQPCPTCTDEQLCEGGLAAKARDEADKQWATYHVNSCQSPATLMGDAQTHRCHRCDHPEDFTDKKPCTRISDLMDLYSRSMAIIIAANEAAEGTQP